MENLTEEGLLETINWELMRQKREYYDSQLKNLDKLTEDELTNLDQFEDEERDKFKKDGPKYALKIDRRKVYRLKTKIDVQHILIDKDFDYHIMKNPEWYSPENKTNLMKWPYHYSPVTYPKNILFTNKKDPTKFWFVCLPWNKELKANALNRYLSKEVPMRKLRFAEPE